MFFINEPRKGNLETTFGPEDIFAYFYAVLHAPSYRQRYADFLKTDFPRIPLTSDVDLFRKLCALGDRLVRLHLMETRGPELASFPVTGSGTVEKVRYAEPSVDTAGRVWINSRQYFDAVPPEVWAFRIGGYHVCEKWLKDRKGRAMNWEKIQHYQGIVGALAETIRLMAAIDTAIEAHGGWPLEVEQASWDRDLALTA